MSALPFFSERIAAGFPSPAQGYLDEHLDLNRLCIRRPASTFLLRVEGDSMVDAGIFSGDILIVDRSLEAVAGDVVVASLEGEFTVKEWPRPCSSRNAAAPIPTGDDGVDLSEVTFACMPCGAEGNGGHVCPGRSIAFTPPVSACSAWIRGGLWWCSPMNGCIVAGSAETQEQG